MIVQQSVQAERWAGRPNQLAVFGGTVRLYVRESVYYLFDSADRLLYVGSSNDPAKRLRGHARTAAWWSHVDRVEITDYPTRGRAEEVERLSILGLVPLHNVAGVPGSGRPYAGGNWKG